MATLHQAMAAVSSGIAEVVLIWRAMNERSAYRFGQPLVPPSGGVVNVAGNGTGSLLWCMPFGAQTPASWEALAAQHYMETFGVSNRDLGQVSVTQRKHAATNPLAWFYGKPITLAPGRRTRIAWTSSPHLSLGMPITATWAIAGWVETALSTSAVKTFSPPVTIMSFTRSRM